MKTSSVVWRCALVVLTATLVAATLQAQTEVRPLPRIVEKNGRFALFVDDAPFLIMGIEDLTMGDWPPRPTVWPALEYMHVNTVEIPVYWEDRKSTRLNS